MTTFVGNHGLFAVALLMFVAAVLPAASEVTMLYGGALASGALTRNTRSCSASVA